MIPRGGSHSRMNRSKRFMSDPGSNLVKCSENRAQLGDFHCPSARSSRSMFMGDIADSQGMNFKYSKMPAEATAWLFELSGHYFGTSGRIFRDESQQLDPYRVRKNRRECVQMVAALLILWHGCVEPFGRFQVVNLWYI